MCSIIRYWHLINFETDDNLNTKCRKGVAQSAVSCHLVSYRKPALFVSCLYLYVVQDFLMFILPASMTQS